LLIIKIANTEAKIFEMLRAIRYSYLNILYKLNSQKATKKIVALFSKPRSPKKQERYNATFQDAIHFNYTYKDKTVSCYKWGKGDHGILLIHSWGGNAKNFNKLIMTLVQNGNTVFAFDAPAHGNSKGKYSNILEFKDIAQELIRQNKEIKGIVGHSIGGVAAALVLKDLEREQTSYKLVLISAPSDLTAFFNVFTNSCKLPHQAFFEGVQYIKNKIGLDLVESSLINMERPVNANTITIIHDKKDINVDLLNSKQLIKHWNISNEHVVIANMIEQHKILSDVFVIERIHRAVSADKFQKHM
jgi:esterase/lipase